MMIDCPLMGHQMIAKKYYLQKTVYIGQQYRGILKKTRFEGFAELENYFFSIGGYSSDFPDFLALNLKEMHISKDGETWKKLPEIAQFSARHAPNIYKYKNVIYILGGNDGRIFSDLWKIEKKSILNMIIFGE